MKFLYSDDPIIACSTSSQSNAALSVLRISGFSSLKQFSHLFAKDLAPIEPRRVYFTKIVHSGQFYDDVCLTFFESPKSYNGENILELSVHGNTLNVERILDLFTQHGGCRPAGPGEFTYRALKNKKLDLSQVEGLDLLLNANSGYALDQGLSFLSGNLHELYQEILHLLIKHKSALELSIDFSEDVGEEVARLHLDTSLKELVNKVSVLHKRSLPMEHNLLQPEIILAGLPNSGKSSLFNLLLSDERAIVSSQAGTTRDYLSETIVIEGVKYKLVDTAGIRDSKDEIEKEGISRSRMKLKNGFFKILLINPFQVTAEFDDLIKEEFDLMLFTHSDLENFDHSRKNLISKYPKIGSIGAINLKSDAPIEPEIYKAINKKYVKIIADKPILFERHRNLISQIYKNLQEYQELVLRSEDVGIISHELNALSHCFNELVGIVSPDTVLDSIFENFCIGNRIVPRGTFMNSFDILIIGGGHAGVEAAYIASQFNLRIGIITMPGIPLASAPCNPSVGGVGKGQVVREIDALGGLMGVLTDLAGIQYRTLNESKGFAVQSSRVQIDKELYSLGAEDIIGKIPNITVIREKVLRVNSNNDQYVVEAQNTYTSKKIIFTVGTFLNGKLHTGSEQNSGGRVDCPPSPGLNDILSKVSTRSLRFKTGTPPRLLNSSIDYSKLEEQPSDSSVRNFHYLNSPFKRHSKQVSCYLAHTNIETMEVIRRNKELSPMFNGQIKGVGARYCPSIEDKAYRYPDKNSHHVFIEPEGLNLNTVYPSGISSSLPKDVQAEYVRSIEGLENAEILVHGYAVEYDVIDTTELNLALEHKKLPGIYFAGQVNGTSGYEEAAGQGWIAGCNASLAILERNPLILSRHESYIGVMIEDLTSNMRDEPYRLFTARSENRLYIREDNSILRMRPYRSSLGLNTSIDIYMDSFEESFNQTFKLCDQLFIPENSPLLSKLSGEDQSQKLTLRMSVSEVLRQAWLNPIKALEVILAYYKIEIGIDLITAVAISKKYEGYIKRSEDQYSKLKKMDTVKLNWEQICNSSNISFECKQRILRIKPETFGQLKKIEGIRPATLAVIAAKAL